MEEKYDVIVLGTGLTECILSGLFSRRGKKVLHIDRNDYYGGESASLNLSQLYNKFRQGASAPESLGRDRDYCIDLIPKLMLAAGSFVQMLVCCDVDKYLDFRQVEGSYVFRSGKIYKVPSTEKEAVLSSLFGLLEKNRARLFLKAIAEYSKDKSNTVISGCEIKKTSMDELYAKFSLDPQVREFIGHAMALHLDDMYLTRPAIETVDRICLYKDCMLRFGKSPYVYTAYGLGELPQAFARCSAVYGGTYMLDTPVDEIFYDKDSGRVAGIVSKGERAYAPLIIACPAYASDKCRSVGRVVRSICILQHPVDGTDNAHSLQLILPQSQLGRKHDIYIVVFSNAHTVAPKPYYIAIASTTVETDTPEKELEPAYALLNPIFEKFVAVVDIYEPTTDGVSDGLVISKSYDATSHFETVSEDVFSLYKRATGNDLALDDPVPPRQE